MGQQIIDGYSPHSSWAYRLVVDYGEPNIVSNYTPIWVTAQVTRTTSSAWLQNSNKPINIIIDGVEFADTISYNFGTIYAWDWQTLWSAGGNVYHSADGTKNVWISSYWDNSGANPAYGSAEAGIQLPTIPRASVVSATNADIGSATSININRYSSSFTHTLKYSFGTLSGTIATGVTTNYGWTVPTSFYSQIPNSGSAECTITCETYSGTSLIGTSQSAFLASANPITNAPTVSATIVDSNATTVALTGNNNNFIKFFSEADFAITATAKNSATINSVGITCGAKSASTSTGKIQAVESGVFNVTATDSRGFIPNPTVSYNKTMVEYIRLTLNATLLRSSPTSDIVTLKAYGNYFNNTFGAVANSISLKYAYKEVGGTYSAYIPLTGLTITNNTYAYEQAFTETFDYRKSYEFEIVISDELSEVSFKTVVAKGTPIFDWNNDNFNINIPLNVTGGITNDGNSLKKEVLTENCLLPVDITIMNSTDGGYLTTVGQMIQWVKRSGGLSVSNSVVTLPAGYVYEFIVTPEIWAGNAIVMFDVRKTSKGTTSILQTLSITSTISDSVPGYGVLDLTSGNSTNVGLYVSDISGTCRIGSKGGCLIKKYKKITI